MIKTLFLTLLFVLLSTTTVYAQVQPLPFVKAQFFDQNGKPLSSGCIFTYQSGTTIPQATYTDYTSASLNQNPVILDAAGRADIWLSAVAYTFVAYSQGGTKCASGYLQWTEDGINPSANSILAQNNIWTGTNTFNAAVIFNSSATFNAGLTSTGPTLLSGGGSITGTWTGSPTFSGTPNFSAGFTATTGRFSGQIISTLATGTAPFSIASSTVVPNLNVSQLLGCTWAVPCPIGSTTPNTGAFTTLNAATSFTLNAGTPQVGTQGTDTHLLTAGTVAGAAGTTVCLDALGGITTSGCTTAGFSKIQAVTFCPSGCTVTGTPCTTGVNSFDICANSIPFPSSFADTNYSVHCDGVNPLDGANPTAGRANLQVAFKAISAVSVYTVTLGAAAVNWSEIDCIGIHP